MKERRGVATFYAFIQVLIFTSRNASTHPTVSLRDIQGKGHIPVGKREHCRRETAGGFQGNGETPLRCGRTPAKLTGVMRWRAAVWAAWK